MATRLYVADLSTVRINQPIIAWPINDPDAGKAIVTTPVTKLVPTHEGLLATTEEQAQYLLTNRR
jgi:hypothetical protein